MTTTKQKNNEFEHQLTDPKEVKNLKEAKKLVELFRRITLSQIKEKWGQLYDCIRNDSPERRDFAFEELYGFEISDIDYLLCDSNMCSYCVHSYKQLSRYNANCLLGSSDLNQTKIMESKTPEELYKLVQKRADFLEKLIKKIERK